MLQHSELTIRGDASDIAALVFRLEHNPISNWKVARVQGGELVGIEAQVLTPDCFENARVTLQVLEESAEVFNIVPAGDPLNHQQYHALGVRFMNEVVRPNSDGLRIEIRIGPYNPTIEDLLPTELAALLRLFSTSANWEAETDIAFDTDLWHEFLAAAHLARATLKAEQLLRLLVEDLSWTHEAALALALRYQTGRDLLRSYDKIRLDRSG